MEIVTIIASAAAVIMFAVGGVMCYFFASAQGSRDIADHYHREVQEINQQLDRIQQHHNLHSVRDNSGEVIQHYSTRGGVRVMDAEVQLNEVERYNRELPRLQQEIQELKDGAPVSTLPHRKLELP